MEFLSNRLVRFLGSPLEQAEKILKSIEHLSVISSRAVVASGNNVLDIKVPRVCVCPLDLNSHSNFPYAEATEIPSTCFHPVPILHRCDTKGARDGG